MQGQEATDSPAAATTSTRRTPWTHSIFTIVHVSGSTVPFNIDNFLPIGNYATDVSILAVHPDAPWTSFEELIGDARNRPGKRSS